MEDLPLSQARLRSATSRLGQLGRPWQHRGNLGPGSAVESFFDRVLGHTLWLLSQDNLKGAEQKKNALGFLLAEEGRD